ncbi:thermonuclease family protein [Haloterrigena sp. SYSU A121-1]|uniref:Thermonuclease family protein n=1 Tax=Haloterrigena gelatinilytica TaxID=2741724 RepID=A0A8J8GIQ9_9EURY|nr:thermonuclease family protein [Haloterrigena gelatinilytica]NUB90396.1 thermonuclease family protein [Haloterrigena gelatinilytica]
MGSLPNGHARRLDRRSFVSLLGATTGTLAISGSSSARGAASADAGADEGLEALSFYSTAAQTSAEYGELTDENHVVAWASEDAYVTTASGGTDESDVVSYEDGRIPLISQDENVMGIGSAGFLSDERGGFDVGNEEFVLEVWDELMGPDSTVLWDESHRQYWDLSSHTVFRRYAEDNGYDLRPLEEFETDGPTLEFYSTASQVSPAGDALTEDRVAAADALEVLAWAEPTATNVDRSDAEPYRYADDERIPLITRDDRAVGLGAPLAADDSDHDENRAFLLGVWDDVVDGETVYWDESHDQYYDSRRFETFIADAEREGYAVEATDDLLAVLEGSASGSSGGDAADADAVVITTPAESFTDAELAALEAFVADGGAVFLHDQSDFGGHAETAHLNAIAERLDLGFRFNDDQVEDATSGWDDYVFETSDFDQSYLGEAEAAIGLADADGLVVTTPNWAFTDAELEALESFVDDGGALFLFDQSDFGGNDRTGNVNEIAERLDLAFRFNGGQVEDEVRNAGPEYVPLATDFSPEFDYFGGRDGVDIEFERDGEYDGRIVRVFDGDTVEVEFDTEYGYREVVRNVGVDTAETPPTEATPEEWFGIPDGADDHLHDWGERAAEFALERLAPEGAAVDESDLEGRHVKVTFDEAEPLRGNYGRLLGSVRYDPDAFEADFESGSFSTNYNREIVAEGYARVYSSGFAAHDEFAALEEDALAAGRGVWSAADFDALAEIRNEPVEDLYLPSARSVRSARGRHGGRLEDDRVAVAAEPSADQRLETAGIAYDDGEIPLVGVDERRRVALVGGIPIHEDYEADEAFGVDTSDYGNFPFLTNLIDALSASDADGDVLIAGGQGQFNAAGSISLEDCMYYQRYLEGIGLRLRQINDLAETLPAETETELPRAVLLSAPARELEIGELLALRRYRKAGGAVVLLGSAAAAAEHTRHLNAVAAKLRTDLRFNADAVADEERHLGDDPTVLETTAFDDSLPLFDAYDPSRDWTDEKGGGDAPGNSGHAPGHRGNGPGNSSTAPGHGNHNGRGRRKKGRGRSGSGSWF